MNIHLRKAIPHDMDAVHALVKQLAEYEKSADEVITSPETYLRDGFTENRFEVLIAEDLDLTDEHKIVGIAFYYWAYSTWKGKFIWLDDLVVEERYRREGIGIQLFNAVMQVAKDHDAMLLKWQVLDWNEPAIKFYNKLHAIHQKEWLTYKLDKADLKGNI